MGKRQEVRDWAIDFFEKNGVWPSGTVVAEAVGYAARDTFRVLAALKQKHNAKKQEFDDTIKKVIEDDKYTLTVNSLTINTVEQALAVADVDLGYWAVKNSRVNSWQVHMRTVSGDIEKKTNYQVRIDLAPKINRPIDHAMKDLIDRLIDGYKPPKVTIRKPGGKYALEVALFDAHFGKLAWDQETLQGDYDVKIAKEVYVKACEDLITHASSHDIEKIYFPFGNDFFHVNNPDGVTPVGKHQLDMDTRLPKIWTAGKLAVLDVIGMLLQVAPVEVIWVPGNHDPETSWFLTEVIKEVHRGNKYLTVDNSPSWRKARLYGNWFVMFTHAANEKIQKLPNIMLVDFKDMMAKAKFCECHIGHIHKKDEFKFQPTVTEAGVLIRRIPALSKIDAWHYKYGFVDAVRAGEAFLIDKDRGVVNHITCNM